MNFFDLSEKAELYRDGSQHAVASLLGTFTSPFSPLPWLNTTLLVAGILAAMERALTLRNHWLIDADTWWLD